MKAWLGWLITLTNDRETGEALAAFRICIGLVVVASLLAVIGPGMVDVIWVDASHGGMRSLQDTSLVAALGGARPEVIWPLVWATLAGAGCVTLGLGGRVVAFITLQGYAGLTGLNWTASGGYDAMLGNALWLLVLGNGTAVWSVDAVLRSLRRRDPRTVYAWPRYLAILQLVVVYTATGLQKSSALWTPVGGYEALYWVLVEPTWRRFSDPTFVSDLHPWLRVATAVTWHWEIGAPLLLLLLWYRRTADRPGRLRRWSNRFDLRSWWLGIGIALHLGILALLDVGPFSFATLAYYPAVLTPGELRSAVRRSFPTARRPFRKAATA